jgi:hypothetical protein
VHEDILAAVVGLYKSIALGRVEPLHSAYRHVRTPFLNNGDNLDPSVSTSQEKPALLSGGLSRESCHIHLAKARCQLGGVDDRILHHLAIEGERLNFETVVAGDGFVLWLGELVVNHGGNHPDR